MAPDDSKGGSVATSTRTIDRAVALLVAVTDAPEGARMTELAQATDLSSSTASRLLATLEGHQFVARVDGGAYRPGIRLVQMAASVLRQLPLYELAGPHLAALAQETGETANLGVPTGDGRVLYLRQAVGPHLVQTVVWTGRTVPVHNTGIGAAIDGRLGPERFAVVSGAIEPDVTGVAAQVVDHHGRAVGGLSVIAPTYRTSEEDVRGFGDAVVRHADALSRELGASQGGPG